MLRRTTALIAFGLVRSTALLGSLILVGCLAQSSIPTAETLADGMELVNVPDGWLEGRACGDRFGFAYPTSWSIVEEIPLACSCPSPEELASHAWIPLERSRTPTPCVGSSTTCQAAQSDVIVRQFVCAMTYDGLSQLELRPCLIFDVGPWELVRRPFAALGISSTRCDVDQTPRRVLACFAYEIIERFGQASVTNIIRERYESPSGPIYSVHFVYGPSPRSALFGIPCLFLWAPRNGEIVELIGYQLHIRDEREWALRVIDSVRVLE